MTQPNRVTLAVWSTLAGAAGGAAVLAFAVWLGSEDVAIFGDPANLVYLGAGVAVLVAMFVGWRGSRGIEQGWARGAVALIGAIGGCGAGAGAYGLYIYSMMRASPVLGRFLLPGYVMVLMAIWAASAAMTRRARAAAPSQGPAT